MLKKLVGLFLVLLIFPIATILANDVEAKILNSNKKEVDSGASFNVLVMLTNNTVGDKSVQLRLKNETDGWKLISNNAPILVKKQSTLNKIIAIQVPNYFKSGDYILELELLDTSNPTFSETLSLPITIKEKYEIALNVLKAPTYLFSGDTANFSYLVKNNSNLDIVAKTTSINGAQNVVKEFSLPKDSSVIVNYSFITNKKLMTSTRHTVIFITSIADIPGTELSTSSPVDVLPVSHEKFDKYERFPVKVTGISASTNRYGNRLVSALFDVRGQGFIGKNRNKTIDFHLRGPDRSGNPLFGLNDEYYFKYKGNHLAVVVGDYNYGLSELTETSRNGRGVELGYTLNKWTTRGYYTSPRYFPQIKHVYAFHSSMVFNPKNSLEIGMLSKIDTANTINSLYTLAANLSPFKWIRASGEIAFGQQASNWSNAYKASLGLSLGGFSVFANYLFADPNFPGYLSNSFRFNSGASLQFSKFALSANYDQNSTKFALDTLYSNMPFSKNTSLTGSYRFTPYNTVTVGGYSISMVDQSPTPLFDFTRSYGRISIMNKFGKFGFTLMGDVGSVENRRNANGPETAFFYNGALSTNVQIQKWLTFALFGNYQGGKLKVTGYDRFYYGCMTSGTIRDLISFSLQYNSNYEWQYYTSDRSLLSLDITGHLNPKNELSLVANYNLVKNSLDQKEYTLQLKYTHTLQLPVARKKDMGSVTGKLINKGVETVSGIRVNLKGMASITDKEGNFKFTALPIGTHYLTVDFSSLGLNSITEESGPISITVEPGKVIYYEVALTKSGRIGGTLIVQEDERANQKGFIPVKDRIEKLVVEANNGTAVFRVYSDRDGNFNFSDLRPGNWQIKIYSTGLPSGYQLKTSIFNVVLEPGKSEHIDVMINKKARQIQFQTGTK